MVAVIFSSGRVRHRILPYRRAGANMLTKMSSFGVYYWSRITIGNVYDAAYQGTRGSNSEDACIDLLSSSARLLPRTTLEDVFAAVTRGEAKYGVVPVENTLA